MIPGSEQMGFHFDAPPPATDGLSRWHQERQNALRDLARQLGLPLEKNVEAILKGGIRLRGILRLAEDELVLTPKRDLRLRLRIERCTFLPTEIESCVRLD